MSREAREIRAPWAPVCVAAGCMSDQITVSITLNGSVPFLFFLLTPGPLVHTRGGRSAPFPNRLSPLHARRREGCDVHMTLGMCPLGCLVRALLNMRHSLGRVDRKKNQPNDTLSLACNQVSSCVLTSLTATEYQRFRAASSQLKRQSLTEPDSQSERLLLRSRRLVAQTG
jgi:hypothetical protein